MKILFAAHERSWDGFFGMIQKALPYHQFVATGRFAVDTLEGFDVLIPTMCPITRETLQSADRLQLIQQCGSGLEGVDIAAARNKNIMEIPYLNR